MTRPIDTRYMLALVVGALLGLAGPASAQGTTQDAPQRAEPGAEGRSGSEQPLSDAWLTAKTKLALLADEDVSGTSINVDTSNGVVTLKGEVEDPAAKAKAVEIARGIKGVKQVEDQLMVRSSQSGGASAGGAAGTPGASGTARRDDEQIAREVRQQIQETWPSGQLRMEGDALKGPQGTSIEVEVDDGVVTLDGTVQSVEDIVRAAQAARRVQGVRSVKTNIESGQPS